MMPPSPSPNSTDFSKALESHGCAIVPEQVVTLQLNITRLCNQACFHCHVDASPRRKEQMSREILEKALDVTASNLAISQIDITGGAPELHADFGWFVTQLREIKRNVIVRHNLTVTMDPHPVTKKDMSYLPKFFADHNVEVVSSLPCYSEELTDKQRGDGVFQKSIASLRLLNELGYGKQGSSLKLNLIFNPNGAKLPPPQQELEQQYKEVLWKEFGIEFHNLYAMTNMPINRFKYQLIRENSYATYMEELANAFNPAAAAGVMCKNLISVGYDGTLYDCDFNQMLKLAIVKDEQPVNIRDWDDEFLASRKIKTANHCFGCTAGTGSSCTGSTSTS